ncbi:MAG: amidohydrolase [Treponema sp.]|jgi:predicted amidohydrolase YtcJ|nr:amidohydrolase [Treponema sp.]
MKSSLCVIHNAKVRLPQGKFCQALLVGNGRILKSGSNEEILETAGAEKIDASGALVLPAFHDSHLHLQWLGRREGMIEGAGALSIEEVLERGRILIEKLKPAPGSYVQGAGVNPDLFTGEKRDPNRYDLDRISTVHPIIISRHCGHTIYCNSLALQMAGLSEKAPVVEGGTIETDQNGRPTGILRENANAIIRTSMPPMTGSEMADNFTQAMRRALSLGITALGSYDINGPDIDEILGVLQELYRGDGPRIRLTMQCGISGREKFLDEFINRGLVTGKVLQEDETGGPMLRMGPLKLFIDGTLGGQTAWMRKPYHDKPETSGFAVLEKEPLEYFSRKAAGAGMQVIAHAIGDAGTEAVVNAFDKIIEGNRNPLRHGIVHCQITDRPLLERIARKNILTFVQPAFLAEDWHILESRVGKELASSSYAWGTMKKLGIRASYGTDAPVSALEPLLNISWAVLRQDPYTGNPPGGYYPAERVDLESAFDAYTVEAAYSSFDEGCLGQIKEGFLADLCFLDRDIFSIPAEEIHKARVIRTMMAGKTVWEP